MESLSVLLLSASEWPDPQYLPLLFGVIILASLGTTGLFATSLIAFIRRQTRRYLLVMVALGALVVRTVIGLGTVLGLVPMTAHHLIGHSVDFLIATLLLYAVYLSGAAHQQLSYAD